MEETQDPPQDHTLTGFRVFPRYTVKSNAFFGVSMLNSQGDPQYQPPSQPLHFVMGEGPTAVVEKEKFDYIKERLRTIEGGKLWLC